MGTKPGLTQAQWAMIGPLLPPHSEQQIRAGMIDDRITCGALTAVLLKELPWSGVSAEYGVSGNTLRLRWWEWCHADVWNRLATSVEERRRDGVRAGPADEWAATVAAVAMVRWWKDRGMRRNSDTAASVAEPPIMPWVSVVDYRAVREAMNELAGDTF